MGFKARSLLYFTSINRCMNFGGTFLSSKYSYLKYLPKQNIPVSCIVNQSMSVNEIKKQLLNHQLDYPIIVKPDIGERGKSVSKIQNNQQLSEYFENPSYQTFILQEYIDYPIELGVLYYRDTNGQGKITSIGLKKFCTVVGNGQDSLKKLISKNPRTFGRKKQLQKRFQNQWNQVLKPNEKVLIEPIGNHNLGTTFLNGNHMFSKEMMHWIDQIASMIPHFDYGRFDLRIKNWESFKKNDGIKILEINGVNSEPIHIYSPKFGLMNAYKEIFKHMHIIHRLSLKQIKKSPPVSIKSFVQAIVDFKNKKEQPNYMIQA
ncbi:MAG: ATP-grasp domain-containing protein [Flavobacteriaceae bacterium]|nr:ATP-grasp domain-containing protein [Flavobacteriaceae bacterium]MCY4266900.1 ATP-grasp domain-containing protein [Flavobacteriaceae bacterium]